MSFYTSQQLNSALNGGKRRLPNKNGMPRPIDYLVVKNNHLQLLSNFPADHQWSEGLCLLAIERGRIKALHFLLSHGVAFTEGTGCGAVMSGRVDMVKALFDAGCPFDKDVGVNYCRRQLVRGLQFQEMLDWHLENL